MQMQKNVKGNPNTLKTVPETWTDADRSEYRRIATRRVNEHLATFTFVGVGLDLYHKLHETESTEPELPLPLPLPLPFN
jgi:hypothetical protein